MSFRRAAWRGLVPALACGHLVTSCSAPPATTGDPGLAAAPAPAPVTDDALPDADALMAMSRAWQESGYRILASGADVGDPLPGLTRTQERIFERGEELFEESFNENEGRGPVFNDNSCNSCHSRGGNGGPGNTIVTRQAVMFMPSNPFNKRTAPGFDPIIPLGGPLLQDKGVNGFRETPPSPAQIQAFYPGRTWFTAKRVTNQVAGDGLLAAVSDSTLLARQNRSNKRYGVTGRVNRLDGQPPTTIPITGPFGRFGWKAQASSLRDFNADALVQEQGISNPDLPLHNLPNQAPPTQTPTEITRQQKDDLDAYSALLAPPAFERIDPLGLFAFNKAGCVECHFYGYRTTGSAATLPSELQPFANVLTNKPVPAFTDLLIHDMGIGLADGIVQGSAGGGEFRTAPLWGLGNKGFYLHDGSASTIQEAIVRHRSPFSEANRVIENYLGISTLHPANNLSQRERDALMDFLESL